MIKHFHHHPPALRTFFATEMWERYGFYVVQSLLALHLALRFGWTDNAIYTLVSAFTGLTYLSPMLGGWIADTWLGQKKSIIVGGSFLLVSYVALALMHTDLYLQFALAGVAVGTGLLKPNISSLLGHSYAENSPERESGFTIFYMGITSGIILGTTLPSYLQKTLGWSATFASAAFGMVIALSVFYLGVKRYRIKDYQERPSTSQFVLLKAGVTILMIWAGCVGVLKNPHVGMVVFASVLILSISYIVRTARKESKKQAAKTTVLGLLCLISVLYWAFYFQMFLSLTLFIARLVEPTFLGIAFPPPYYVCVESIGMLVFGYFIAKHRKQLSKSQVAQRAGNKFFLAILSIALSYVIVICSILFSSDAALISPLFIIPAYLLISISELLLSPVGLSIVTVLADRKRVSTLMGIFFVSLSLGGYLSGLLAKTTNIQASWTDLALIRAHYLHGFSVLFLILAASVVISFFINYLIKKHYILAFEG
ncbi:MAG: oligopeptide:H+ symporter [Gammaproteobacteria bacterium]|nr:oligopeptide:H+ symporter [Gammaproteobacteria bacterium]